MPTLEIKFFVKLYWIECLKPGANELSHMHELAGLAELGQLYNQMPVSLLRNTSKLAKTNK